MYTYNSYPITFIEPPFYAEPFFWILIVLTLVGIAANVLAIYSEGRRGYEGFPDTRHPAVIGINIGLAFSWVFFVAGRLGT